MGRGEVIMTCIKEREGVIRDNIALTEKLWLIKIDVDEIGADLQPGQFIHVLIPGMEGHMLRRPFSVYYTENDGRTLVVLYQVVGYGSAHLTTLSVGTSVSVMGPIGNGWTLPESCGRALLVAGGVGGAPLYLHAEELKKHHIPFDVVLGAQTASALVVEDKYASLMGYDPYVATDDGSKGHAGFCTDVVAQRIADVSYDYVACCGPEPMMRIISQMTLDAGIPTFISLEKRMACGIGACLSCIVETVEGRKRSCVDGPVFDAVKVVW